MTNDRNGTPDARDPAGPPGTPGQPPPLDERSLREALHSTAMAVRPGVWPEQRVLERVRRRRARRIGAAVPLVAAAAVVAVALLGRAGAPHTAPAPPATAPASASPSVRAPTPSTSGTPVVPEVLVVRPGRAIPLGQGKRMRLDPDQRCTADSGVPSAQWTCKSVVDGNQGQDSVSLQSSGGPKGDLYTPLYIGSGHPVRMTVTADGTTVELRVVTLPGHPGYATGYGWGPPRKSVFGDESVRVYAADGTVLAHFETPPQCDMTWSPDPQGGRTGHCVRPPH